MSRPVQRCRRRWVLLGFSLGPVPCESQSCPVTDLAIRANRWSKPLSRIREFPLVAVVAPRPRGIRGARRAAFQCLCCFWIRLPESRPARDSSGDRGLWRCGVPRGNLPATLKGRKSLRLFRALRDGSRCRRYGRRDSPASALPDPAVDRPLLASSAVAVPPELPPNWAKLARWTGRNSSLS